MPSIPFHLAFPVRDLETTRSFYVDVLGCQVGRSAERWIDFDFYGHQLSAHLTGGAEEPPTNLVDGDAVPARHFGAVLPWETWHEVRDRLKRGETRFLIEPRIRFEGEPGEQATMFILDPSGNAIELKSFKDPGQLFAT
jgi:extradiol dioxygenase family protein